MTPQRLLDVLRDNAHARASVFGPDDSSVVVLLEMRKCVLEMMQSNEGLARALSDAISTYDPTRPETLVNAERQEAWAAALEAHKLQLDPPPTPPA